jgi:hypothetical protein
MSLDIATVPGQAESEAGGELDETNHSTTTPKWSNAHAILVLCLIIRACGSSDEEAVEGVVSPLQFEGVCGYSLEESALRALALIPQIEETSSALGLTDDAAATSNSIAVDDSSSTGAVKADSKQNHILGQVLGRELQAMDRGGIRHGHGYEF